MLPDTLSDLLRDPRSKVMFRCDRCYHEVSVPAAELHALHLARGWSLAWGAVAEKRRCGKCWARDIVARAWVNTWG